MIYRAFDLQFFAEEKTETATPRKRRKSREEGQVARSQDLGAAVVILVGLLAILLLAAWWLEGFREFIVFQAREIRSDQLGQGEWISRIGRVALRRFMSIWLPFGFLCLIAALAVQIYQVGLQITTKPLIPKPSRMNPISGLKKVISIRSFVELAKSIVKAGLLGIVLFMALKQELGAMAQTVHFPLFAGVSTVMGKIWWLAMKMALLLFVIAIFDYVYQRWEFERQIKMTKKEVKDEYKQMEGDPMVKRRIRQKQQELARSRMMEEVPQADVVVTNPTTLAVALQYDRSVMDAPLLVAKGRGHVARKIREIAEEHGVPVVEDRPLAWSLYEMVEIGEEIPEHLYKAVAEVLAFVYRVKTGSGT
ncbi:MAG: flagellar biosynthesis protein FlhB [Synergistales bacterium]|nr:flagellar biosynthesis protein FlhB [Synergistales bacterium]